LRILLITLLQFFISLIRLYKDARRFSVDGKEIVVRIIKYVLEGAMVAIAVALIPVKTFIKEILTIALIAATFSLLDMFAPSIINRLD
jgi:hypothetical protein